jgi:hypothetical protein
VGTPFSVGTEKGLWSVLLLMEVVQSV